MALVKVRYKGFSDVREITAKQLEPLGIKVSKDLLWDRKNAHVLHIDATDELITILRNEGTFTVSEVKDSGEVGEDIVAAEPTALDDSIKAESVTVDNADTGQKSTSKNKSAQS